METGNRTLAKALSWQASGLVAMTLIGWAWTGSATAGGSMALFTTGVGFVTYIAHERVWARISWGREADQARIRERYCATAVERLETPSLS